ncbi:hypothetical protein K504DRAFT_528877 [Pleomassaria siparia CBS 279.74]|uniref:MFS general substrate transporter n=1 Tax=Pleomassaria siparia CBS 279.74 TaxID=1314801 RepID=A0A6G1KNZ8_9PLEO|nr:hypothetical protein K504DRAFT_528877 [Pleomassaria siparia CBS 279.74]
MGDLGPTKETAFMAANIDAIVWNWNLQTPHWPDIPRPETDLAWCQGAWPQRVSTSWDISLVIPHGLLLIVLCFLFTLSPSEQADTAQKPDVTETSSENPPSTLDEAQHVEPASEKTTPTNNEAGEGGLQAWLVVSGTAFILFAALSFVNSFGVFQGYYMTHQLQHKSPDDVTWIGSMCAFLQLAADGLFSGSVFDRYGAWIIRPLSIVYVFAIMMLSPCNAYWHFMLVHGGLTGMVLGPPHVSFYNCRLPILQQERSDCVGRGCIPVFNRMCRYSHCGLQDVQQHVSRLRLVSANHRVRFVATPGSLLRNHHVSPSTTEVGLPETCMSAPIFFLSTYAVSRGVEVTLASYLVAILNASSMFGRIIPGILADRSRRLNILALGGALTGIMV